MNTYSVPTLNIYGTVESITEYIGDRQLSDVQFFNGAPTRGEGSQNL